MSTRAAYIKKNYSLTQDSDGTWVGLSCFGVIRGRDRGEVVREARCRWGHFNFEDEARAFGEIFSGARVLP